MGQNFPSAFAASAASAASRACGCILASGKWRKANRSRGPYRSNNCRTIGWALPADSGYQCFPHDPGGVRKPDVSFVRYGRFPGRVLPKGWAKIPPDLAVEVLSENNTRGEIDARLKDFFASGTRIAWVIDPERQRVEVCHSPIRRQLIGSGGVLEGEDLLPGFQFLIADLFKEWDWD